LFVCPDGTAGLFCFLPNAGLRPEVGKNKEVGLNLKYNDIFTSGDSFRGKFNVFRNDVDGYIDLVASTPVPVPPFGSFSQFFSTRTSRMPGSKASRPRRCMMQACGMSVSPAT
jgi:hemoglobin/transferrin/lactoferrin receptor protein